MSDIQSAATHVVRRLREAGHEALFAGGFVRDRFLNRPIKDIDIATAATPDQVIALFPKTVPIGKAFGVILVLHGDLQFEVATFRSDGRYLDGRRPESVRFSNAREDAQRRDFTINGMFFDPLDSRVMDYVGGEEDLKRKVLRTIGNPVDRFGEDRLRMMRAVRFASQLQLAVDPAAIEAIRSLAPSILEISWERIRDEFGKILVHNHRRAGLEMLMSTGLLHHVMPELIAMVGVQQPPEYHPEGDVWTHTLICIDSLVDPSMELAFAVLLHDVGKPRTFQSLDRIRFNNHDRVGAEMARDILGRMKFSNEALERIVWLVARHLAFLQFEEMKKSTVMKLFASPYIDDLLKVIRADTMGSMASTEFIDRLARMKAEAGDMEVKPPAFISGKDLIEMGHTPGAEFKRVLSEVYDAQLEGIVTDRDNALQMARKLFDNKSKAP